jgi:hypothetical protein
MKFQEKKTTLVENSLPTKFLPLQKEPTLPRRELVSVVIVDNIVMLMELHSTAIPRASNSARTSPLLELRRFR